MRIDIRSLLAATVVAAFAASTWQLDAGLSVALTAILSACGAVRLGRSEGENSHRASTLVGMAGGVTLLLAWCTQFLICGTRPGLLWGTVACVCLVSLLAIITTYSSSFARWMKRTLLWALLVLVVACGVRCFQTRNAQVLMARHFVDIGYAFPSLGMADIEPNSNEATPLRARLRVLLGIAKPNYLQARNEMRSAEWQAASSIDTLLSVSIERITIEADDIPEVKFVSQPHVYIWQADLKGDALAKVLLATDSGSVTLSCTRVDSYEGLSRASKVREIVFYDMTIPDELIDELAQLPSLIRVKFWDNATPTEAQIARLKNALPNLAIDCVDKRDQLDRSFQ